MEVASVEECETNSKLARVFLLGGLEEIKNYRKIESYSLPHWWWRRGRRLSRSWRAR